MNTFVRIPGLLALLALLGCAKPSPPMLHRLDAYAGQVRITTAGEAELVSDLAFSRAAGTFQVKFRRGQRVVTVVRGAGQAVSTFEDARERATDATERSWYSLVHDLCDPAKVQAVEVVEGGYRVRRGGRWHGLKIESQARVRIHGEPR